ncbi:MULTISPECIES: hypothetical protein [unclassified Mesorhizobium]|uniref:hypothetical protein n=1 Tax=unclassified Mesorhizobium TaxID=325217 RepID=UPI001129F75F|nr:MULTISPECIES: hypothetical protein [unclassified Mesorhizobium]TPK90630.1 hypothetical protein FJ567_29380 [Mesorhizobium sp. B2-4-16]TPL58314.1 hypothetical protein FJ956_29470 [Mesorhizobium sp. B2-4-3]
MRNRPFSRLAWLALRAFSALALTVAPWHVIFEGTPRIAVATADAGNGYSGNGGNGGNGSGGNSGSAGGSNSGSAGGSNSGNSGNSGNSNAGGNSGNSNAGGGNPNAGPGNNSGKGNTDPGGKNSYTNATTGDTLSIDGDKVTVIHRNGMKEQVQNGRFEMMDAQGRTIIERQATEEDLSRLLSL